MKVSIERDILLAGLQAVQSVVEKKATAPILGNVLCTASKGSFSIAATDLDIGLKLKLPAQIHTEGQLTVAAKQFLDTIREMPNKPVDITRMSNDWVEVRQTNRHAKIVSLPAEQYPQMESFEDKEYFEVQKDFLHAMINRTVFAASTDATRFNLRGVYFEQLDGAIFRMTATDGHRLSFVDHELFKKSPVLKRGLIIPSKGLLEIRKILERTTGVVQLGFDRNVIFARTEDSFLSVKTIDAEYPDYKMVIPKQVENLAKIHREELISCIRQVSIYANEKSRGIKLVFSPGQLTLIAHNPDLGESDAQLPIQYSGPSVEVGFNAKYLLDCLPVIESDEIEFKFRDKVSPGILQGAAQRNHTYVIMPMRV